MGYDVPERKLDNNRNSFGGKGVGSEEA